MPDWRPVGCTCALLVYQKCREFWSNQMHSTGHAAEAATSLLQGSNANLGTSQHAADPGSKMLPQASVPTRSTLSHSYRISWKRSRDRAMGAGEASLPQWTRSSTPSEKGNLACTQDRGAGTQRHKGHARLWHSVGIPMVQGCPRGLGSEPCEQRGSLSCSQHTRTQVPGAHSRFATPLLLRAHARCIIAWGRERAMSGIERCSPQGARGGG